MQTLEAAPREDKEVLGLCDRTVPEAGSRPPRDRDRTTAGFTMVEMLIAMLILAFGLLAGGQMIYVSVASESLARSKWAAAVAAQSRVELLADVFSRDQADVDLTVGNHGPVMVQVANPAANRVLNRFNITWTVSTVPDPRPGKVLLAKQVVVTVTPVDAAGATNLKAFLNKMVAVSAVFSPRN